jgi:hypothetical protein
VLVTREHQLDLAVFHEIGDQVRGIAGQAENHLGAFGLKRLDDRLPNGLLASSPSVNGHCRRPRFAGAG